MNELANIPKTMSSREIAELTGKMHKNVLADCDKLNENYRNMGLAEISAGVYTLPQTGNQQHREYNLTKIQTFDLMTGYNAELRIRVNRRWEELEKRAIDFTNPDAVLRIVQNWKADRDRADQLHSENELRKAQMVEQNRQIRALEPGAAFANMVSKSVGSILVRDFAKLLCDEGYNIGEKRLFRWFRENGYMMQNNMPYQKYMDMDLFEVVEHVVASGDYSFTNHTPRITGKGQVYFTQKIRKVGRLGLTG